MTIRRWIRSERPRSEKVDTQHLVQEVDVLGVADAEPLDLPVHWREADGGLAMPPWERLVRDARDLH